MNTENCQHVYGYNEAEYGDPGYFVDWETTYADVIFKYCPNCGKKLKETK